MTYISGCLWARSTASPAPTKTPLRPERGAPTVTMPSTTPNPRLIAVVHGAATDGKAAIVGFQSLNPDDCVTPEGDDQSLDRAGLIAVDAGLSHRYGPDGFGPKNALDMVVWVAPDGDPYLWLTSTSILRVIARRIRLLRSDNPTT